MTYVLMKVLESVPSRYDRGIRILTRGKLGGAYDRLTAQIQPGDRVLDLGCGTGALTLRAAARGAQVKGIDVNPQMLEIARQRILAHDRVDQVELCEMGVAELDGEPSAGYDVVMSGLCFSELSADEQRFALAQAYRLLAPGGRLLIADEVLPQDGARRLLHRVLKVPLVVITYLLTQTTTRAVHNLPQAVAAAGFAVESMHLNRLHDFLELVARKPDRG